MFETIRPYCKGSILEIGSGIGNISRYFVDSGATITLSDTETFYVQTLKENFPSTNVLTLDLIKRDFLLEYRDLMSSFDTVFLLNVLEHIEEDAVAVRNCSHLLKAGGRLIILTPSYPSLYSRIDKGLHHYRRYTATALKQLLSSNGLRPEKTLHFNALGIVGWSMAKMLGDSKIDPGKMRLFNTMVGFARFIDKVMMNRVGLSIIGIAEKTP